ncbi:N6-adenine-specific methylase [Sulfuricella denitrificans skB26]|uniref:N6-adenine-specific methylase n=1 Tax=Sulfuricella denitrificans (strain DSM 22764 / NBRC 105220 / skB26) TaxID=1163617 RepID=S6AB09_SULDS|nr:16S rRNA (guanine(966)-N(2))-methyltransferase RsmD [Sulfuricella denitrificans]BAN36435.1 N6-adenine-specific methylase [Sulfuricella denitrificans skB26]
MVQQSKVRIIAGEWRGRLINFPQAEGLRPTPDRVRETLFNWLGQTLDGMTCLDLFAGSGALGFEALSRGAKRVVMVEQNPQALKALQENARKLGADRLDLVAGDGLKTLSREGKAFDVIFLDPPFHHGILPLLLPLLPDRLATDGFVYAETEQELEPGEGWEVWRNGRAGNVFYCLLKRKTEGPHGA